MKKLVVCNDSASSCQCSGYAAKPKAKHVNLYRDTDSLGAAAVSQGRNPWKLKRVICRTSLHRVSPCKVTGHAGDALVTSMRARVIDNRDIFATPHVIERRQPRLHVFDWRKTQSPDAKCHREKGAFEKTDQAL